MIKYDEQDVVFEALWVISHATVEATYHQSRYMVNAGVLDVYAEALQSNDSRNHNLICEGLESIFSHDTNYPKIFESVGGVDILEQLESNDKALDILSMSFPRHYLDSS